MGLKKESRVLGEHEYEVTQLGAVAGREALRRLSRLMSSSLEGAQKTMKEEGMDAVLLEAILGMVRRIEADDLNYFCDVFGGFSTVKFPDGRKPTVASVFDIHFSGNYFEMTSWLAFCIEVNFKGFLVAAFATISKGGESATQAPASS